MRILKTESQQKTLLFLNQEKYYLDTNKGEFFSKRKGVWVRTMGKKRGTSYEHMLGMDKKRHAVYLTTMVWLRVNGIFSEDVAVCKIKPGGPNGIHNLELRKLTVPHISKYPSLKYEVVHRIRLLYNQKLTNKEISNITGVSIGRVDRLVLKMKKGKAIWQEKAHGEFHPPGRVNAKRSVKSH